MRSLDPRWIQIIVLLSLLGTTLLTSDFAPDPFSIAFVFAAVLCAQAAFSLLVRIPFEWRSALISGLSLVILVRSVEPMWFALVGVLAIGSKFCLRFKGKHFVNPTNFAIVVSLLIGDLIWVEHGQWTNTWAFAVTLLVVGVMLTLRVRSSVLTLAFLVTYAGLVLGYRLWLGDPLDIFANQMRQTSLIIFSLFMISDPRSTPSDPLMKLAFGCSVGVLAFFLKEWYFQPNALFYSLFALCFLTPTLDLIRPAQVFRWDLLRRGLSAES